VIFTPKIVNHTSIIASDRSSYFYQIAFISVQNILLPPR